MSSLTSADNDYTCPVCHDDFHTPKILPCYHLACSGCILSWLQEKGREGGCPLCRAPVLTPSLSLGPEHGDLTTLVDALPTDLLTTSLVKSQQVLRQPHSCAVCSETRAISYCFQCAVKVCATCRGHHRTYPALKGHQLEDLDKLSVDRLSARQPSSCESHGDKAAELYCASHHELICMLCAATNHRACPEMHVIGEVVKERREELGRVVGSLKSKEAALLKQICSRKDFLNEQREEIKKVFDSLHDQVEKRRQELYDVIQKQEDDDAALEKLRATVALHAVSMGKVAGSSSDDVVLRMMKQMAPRTSAVEAKCGEAGMMEALEEFRFDSRVLSRMKEDLSKLGERTQSVAMTTSPAELKARVDTSAPTTMPRDEASAAAISTPATTITTITPATPSFIHPGWGESGERVETSLIPPASIPETPRPTGEELARILSVGNRVKASGRHPEFMKFHPGVGTVTAIPSRMTALQGWDPWGWVDVSWEGRGQWNCRMGCGGLFELELL